MITAISSAAGVGHATGHVLRHTFGAELIRRGVDIVTVAGLMGYASLEPAEPDARRRLADLQRAIDVLAADE